MWSQSGGTGAGLVWISFLGVLLYLVQLFINGVGLFLCKYSGLVCVLYYWERLVSIVVGVN